MWGNKSKRETKEKKQGRKTARKKKTKNRVLLNLPVSSSEKDWIGVESYVDNIEVAIKSGAQVIGITSDFGTGKSSLLSLYNEKYIKHNNCLKRKRMYYINLWETLDGENDVLHKTFLYHIVNQISPYNGSYISKRLNKSYGIFMIQGRSIWFSMAFLLGFAFCLFGVLANKFDVLFMEILELTSDRLQVATRAAFIIAFALAFFAVIKSEVVFSYKQSEGNREVDKNIITDYFNREIMLKGWKRKNIFVVEDLDRSQDITLVKNFMKEIRRYYLSDNNWLQKLHSNRVIFIVCIKPEALLQKCRGVADYERLQKDFFYSKVFDYVINLNPVNIDNIEPIFNGLLDEISDNLVELGLVTSKEEATVENIPGMSWIMSGKKVDIREVKEKLNVCLSMYENLKSKFSDKDISFEKCAIVVYLMKEYPIDYYKLEDRSVERAFEDYLSGKLSEDNILDGNFSDAFKKEVFRLIHNKKIDSTYRTYFYNYPQKSKLYNVCEMNVYNSIVYCEKPSKKDEFEKRLLDVNRQVIIDALSKLKQLSISLPLFVLDYKKIGEIVLTEFKPEFFEMIDQLSLDHRNIKQSTHFYSDMFEKYFAQNYFKGVVEVTGQIIRNNIKDMNDLLYLRTELCKVLKENMSSLDILYKGELPIISEEEIQIIAKPNVVLELVDYNSDAISDEICLMIHQLIVQLQSHEDIYSSFYRQMIHKVPDLNWLEMLKEYCRGLEVFSDNLIELFDEQISGKVWEKADYVEAISNKSEWSYAELKAIDKLDWVDGLKPLLCQQLLESGFYRIYLANVVKTDLESVNFMDEKILETMKQEANWFASEGEESVSTIRKHILSHRELTNRYAFLFEEPFEIIQEDEIELCTDYQFVIEIIRDRKLTDEQIGYIADYFSSTYRNPKEAFEIMKYIVGLREDVEKFFFKLDLKSFAYNRMAKDKRQEIERELFPLLGLPASSENVVVYLHNTRLANPDLEQGLYRQLNRDIFLKNLYVEFANDLPSVNSVTLENISKLNSFDNYSEVIERALINKKNYTRYIYSRWKGRQSFVFEEDKVDILWDTYVELYHGEDEELVQSMSENDLFIKKLVDKEMYRLSGSKITRYEVAFQTKVLVEYVFSTLSNADLISYFGSIRGFCDYDAARAFVKMIQDENAVLKNKKVYDHCHTMLLNPSLQGWYTKSRNRLIP